MNTHRRVQRRRGLTMLGGGGVAIFRQTAKKISDTGTMGAQYFSCAPTFPHKGEFSASNFAFSANNFPTRIQF